MKEKQLKEILIDLETGSINKYQAFDLINTLFVFLPQPRKTVDEIYEQYIGNGQMGIDFEKKHIIEALKVAAGQFECSQPRKTELEILKLGDNALTEFKKEPNNICTQLNRNEDISFNTGFHRGFAKGFEYAAQFQGKELRDELIKFAQQFYADEETCIHNIDEYLKKPR